MRILITGATGLLGRAVYAQLKENKDYHVTGTGFSRAKPPVVKLNLTDAETSASFLSKEKPDWIIHCAAERRPDVSKADPEGSERLNVGVTRMLAVNAAELGSGMLYISTDYVFDGTNPPYYPDCRPNPLNFYGRTKLEGEKAVQEVVDNHIILRVPILYGTEVYPSESSISSIAVSLMGNRGGTFDDVAVRYPTNTRDVACVIAEILSYSGRSGSLKGIYHFSGNECMTKYQMALAMADFMDIGKECISPDKKGSGGADRPKDSHLDTEKLEKEVPFTLTPFREGIEPVLKRLFGI